MDERDKRLLLETYGRRTLDLMGVVFDDTPEGEFIGYDDYDRPLYRRDGRVYRRILKFIWVYDVDSKGNQIDEYVPVMVEREVIQEEQQ